jgi:hypothetical protein
MPLLGGLEENNNLLLFDSKSTKKHLLKTTAQTNTFEGNKGKF